MQKYFARKDTFSIFINKARLLFCQLYIEMPVCVQNALFFCYKIKKLIFEITLPLIKKVLGFFKENGILLLALPCVAIPPLMYWTK